MKAFTGKERIEATVRRERTDRVPYNIDVGPHYSPQIGYSIEQYFGNIETAIECQLKSVEAYPSDLLTVPLNLGAWLTPKSLYRFKTNKEGVSPGVLKDKKAMEDIEAIPSEDCESLDRVIDSCKKITGVAKNHATRTALFGPAFDAALLVGLEDWIVDMKEDPKFIHELMRLTTNASKDRIERIIDSTNVMIYVVGEPHASCSTISPEIYQEFVFPYHKELFQFIKERAKDKSIIGLHICGYVDPIMKNIVDLGIDWVELDEPSSLKKMVEESQGKVIIRGNIGAEIFSEGTKEQIEQAVKGCIETASESNAYVLSSGCLIPLTTPLENVKYFMEAAQRYGGYEQ